MRYDAYRLSGKQLICENKTNTRISSRRLVLGLETETVQRYVQPYEERTS